MGRGYKPRTTGPNGSVLSGDGVAIRRAAGKGSAGRGGGHAGGRWREPVIPAEVASRDK